MKVFKGAAKAGIYLALILVTAALAVGILANSVLPLAIAVVNANIVVKNEAGVGVANARVDCYMHTRLEIGGWVIYDSVPSSPSYSMYTEIGGVASRTIGQAYYTITITATGYEEKTADADLRTSGEVNPSRTVTFILTGGGTPPTGHDVDFYLVGPGDDRVSAYITVGSQTLTSDAHGFARFNLNSGVYSVRFHGYYLEDMGAGSFPVQRNFDFTKSVTVTKPDVFTVYLVTQSIVNQLPPAEEVKWDLTAILAWLQSSVIAGIPNWALVAVAAFLILRR